MTKTIIAHELMKKVVSKSYIAKHLNVSRQTLIRWSQAIKKSGSLDEYLQNMNRKRKYPGKNGKHVVRVPA